MKNKIQKGKLHPRNVHNGQYDFSLLIKACPELQAKVIKNPKGQFTINFSDAQSVLLLNKALLSYFYQIHYWQLPAGYLCPPIPGRVDYIHYIADLLANSCGGKVPEGNGIKALDIGCGANCIYPLLGASTYHWNFVGADIDALAVKTAKLLVTSNKNISKKITIKQQQSPAHFFTNIINSEDRFAFTLCNPPFHASMAEASKGSLLKQKNLNKKSSPKNKKARLNTISTPELNFAGQQHELSCEGGELEFVKKMVTESALFKQQVCWFTCLLSKGENITPIKKLLSAQNVPNIKVIEMSQGHKISRFIAWSYLSDIEQQAFFS